MFLTCNIKGSSYQLANVLLALEMANKISRTERKKLAKVNHLVAVWSPALHIIRISTPFLVSIKSQKTKQPVNISPIFFVELQKRSWFSKFSEPSLPLLGVKICPAELKSLSLAAEAGNGYNLYTAGTDLRTTMVVAGQVYIQLL